MSEVIESHGFRIALRGLTRKEAELLAGTAADKTYKELAREQRVAPDTIKKRADRVRFKMGMQHTMRGVIVEAFRRGIITPLALVMMLNTGHTTEAQPIRRPERPRTLQQVRITRPEFLLTA
ncbi:LuxR C-terminal-related transcriptional regulator [Pseudomonas sp. TTU2014-080ASC]|uniref:LuxR C-terminal-related transcriptional regulator n=1 Tax=Pseudomonas sp. TTU2014-080ASC TaxID=1729724 RepID=UPI0007187EEC|nr:LuxR C-terminal-related transcriptional regulator [Pseudomonas sp. TTU2014-080ASC]KRW62360.1 hypothetical protein AO726_02755 [Pseudomonas sp. TTU2014-080ASC]